MRRRKPRWELGQTCTSPGSQVLGNHEVLIALHKRRPVKKIDKPFSHGEPIISMSNLITILVVAANHVRGWGQIFFTGVAITWEWSNFEIPAEPQASYSSKRQIKLEDGDKLAVSCRVATAWLGFNAPAHTSVQGRNKSPKPFCYITGIQYEKPHLTIVSRQNAYKWPRKARTSLSQRLHLTIPVLPVVYKKPSGQRKSLSGNDFL